MPYKEVVKGYELRAGKYVVLTQEEIDAAGGERSHLIELEEFVGGEEIDPVYYDRSYYLGAGRVAATAIGCFTRRSGARGGWESDAGYSQP